VTWYALGVALACVTWWALRSIERANVEPKRGRFDRVEFPDNSTEEKRT